MVNFAFIFHLTKCWRMVEFVCHFTSCLYMVEFVCHFTPCLYMVYCLHHAYVWSNLLYIWHHVYVWSNLLDIWHNVYVWSNLLMFDTLLMYGRFAINLRAMLIYLNMYDQLLLSFLVHLAFRPCELLSSLFVFRPSSVRQHLIFSSETTGPIATKLWWNGPWMAPFQNCVRWSRFPTKMAAKLKIEKRGDEILIVHCCFSISQNELKF